MAGEDKKYSISDLIQKMIVSVRADTPPVVKISPEELRCAKVGKQKLDDLNATGVVPGGNGASNTDRARANFGALIAFEDYKNCMAENAKTVANPLRPMTVGQDGKPLISR